jgi:hypothetical protein
MEFSAQAALTITFRRAAEPRVQPDPPVRAFYLAIVGGGGSVNLVLLGDMHMEYTGSR